MFFFQIFGKDGLSKKIAPEYDLSCIIRKDDISFPENMILFFRHRRKDNLSQKNKKNTWKYHIFFRCSEKMVFLKNSRLNMIFFVITGKMVFLFSRKHDIFSLGGKWRKIIFIKKSVEIWYFLYICADVTGVTLPTCQKKKDVPKKYT